MDSMAPWFRCFLCLWQNLVLLVENEYILTFQQFTITWSYFTFSNVLNTNKSFFISLNKSKWRLCVPSEILIQLLISESVLLLQVGVYMGKRDFVDRVDSVDPVGESSTRLYPESELFIIFLKHQTILEYWNCLWSPPVVWLKEWMVFLFCRTSAESCWTHFNDCG